MIIQNPHYDVCSIVRISKIARASLCICLTHIYLLPLGSLLNSLFTHPLSGQFCILRVFFEDSQFPVYIRGRQEELVSKPSLISSGKDWQRWHLPTHRNHSYDVNRYNIGSSVDIQTEGKCHVLNLVEGLEAEVITAEGRRFHLNYAETLVISAAAGSYKIVNNLGKEIMVVIAFMK